jgi:hypothetical protein
VERVSAVIVTESALGGLSSCRRCREVFVGHGLKTPAAPRHKMKQPGHSARACWPARAMPLARASARTSRRAAGDVPPTRHSIFRAGSIGKQSSATGDENVNRRPPQ